MYQTARKLIQADVKQALIDQLGNLSLTVGQPNNTDLTIQYDIADTLYFRLRFIENSNGLVVLALFDDSDLILQEVDSQLTLQESAVFTDVSTNFENNCLTILLHGHSTQGSTITFCLYKESGTSGAIVSPNRPCEGFKAGSCFEMQISSQMTYFTTETYLKTGPHATVGTVSHAMLSDKTSDNFFHIPSPTVLIGTPMTGINPIHTVTVDGSEYMGVPLASQTNASVEDYDNTVLYVRY